MISTMLLIICSCVFVFAAVKLGMIYLDYKTGVDEYKELTDFFTSEKILRGNEGSDYEGDDLFSLPLEYSEDEDYEEDPFGLDPSQLPAMECPVDFESLCSINEDVIGWLEMEAVPGISYPMVQGEDNDYYLHRTFQRTDNFAGSIFMDYVNNRDFTDPNTIIYGHNMKNGSMFGSLKNYREKDVFEKSPYFWIYTPDYNIRYEIFSYTEVSKNSDAYQTDFNTEEDFLDYLYTRKDESEKPISVELKATDHVVTLSTCTGNSETRFIVQGKIVKVFRSVPKKGGYDTENN